MKKICLALVMTAFLAFGQTALAQSSYTATWKFAHNETERGTMQIYAAKFKELVETKSGGKIKVDIFPDGTLGAGDSIIELLQGGGLEFALADSGYIGSFVPESQLFRVHYLLTDDTGLNRKLLQGKAIQKLNELFMNNDMRVMQHFQKGFMYWTGNKAFRTQEDLKGVKMRTVPTPILIDTYKAYGSNPTTVNYSELYSALQLGMVDAQENPLATVEELKLNEVQKVLTLSEHYSFISTCVANPVFYDKLPAEVKQMVAGIFAELDGFIEKAINEYDANMIKEIREKMGMEIVPLTPEQKTAFREFNEKNRKILEPSLGKKGMEILYALQEEKAALRQ